MAFYVNQEFNTFQEVLEAKKAYELQNNVVLVRCSHKLKGESEVMNRIIYNDVSLRCKAGKERRCESKGLRKSSTYKKNCPMRINLVFKKDKLKVSSINETHENHQLNEQTFLHYPEQLRLTEEEKKKAGISLAADGNKFKIKAQLTADRKQQGNQAPVSLKSLHNLQTTSRLEKEKLIPGENQLEKLLESMLQVTGAIVRVLRDQDNELCCIYFQDPRMASMFDKYPELLLYDATYKMNDRELPLFVQSVVDGNGITEIASLAICKSESRVVINFILDCFKELNPSWEKIKCVIGDKDFADRIVYKEKFPGVAMQICLFHVLRTFNREISAKRDITKVQREKALEILQRLCYANSSEYYDEQYVKLCELNIENVTDYFNTNWHNIRQEWTLFGRNEYSNYLNNTNNRSESMNQKIKMVGTRNANLLTFFENVSTSVSVLASEKDIKAVRIDMRVERIRFDNVNLRSYYEFLTPFIFTKINLEFENMPLVIFASCDENTAITNSGRTVTSSKCSCEFHLSMILPCRHILQFREQNEMDLFAPELCAARWTSQYYNQSHPALQMSEHNPKAVPIYIQKVRVPEEKDKYKATASITKEINTLVSTMSAGEYTFYLEKLKSLKNQIIIPTTDGESRLQIQGVNASADFNISGQMAEVNVSEESVLDLSVPKASSNSIPMPLNGSSPLSNGVSPLSNGSSPLSNGVSPSSSESSPLSNGLSSFSNGLSSFSNASSTSNLHPFESRLIIVAPTSNDIQQIKLPYKHKSSGRPKGATNTVIGTKRKGKTKEIKAKKMKGVPAASQMDQNTQRCNVIRIFKQGGEYKIGQTENMDE